MRFPLTISFINSAVCVSLPHNCLFCCSDVVRCTDHNYSVYQGDYQRGHSVHCITVAVNPTPPPCVQSLYKDIVSVLFVNAFFNTQIVYKFWIM